MATKLTALLLAICGLLAASCGPKKTGAPSTQPAGSKSATDAAAPKETAPNTREEPAEVDPLKRLELELAEAKKDNRRLRRWLEDQEAARASLEERYAGLEIELASSVEEVLRSKASLSPNRKIFEARKRETAALGAGEKLVLGHPLAATIGDSARCMQNLEKVLFTGPKTSDTVTFICD